MQYVRGHNSWPSLAPLLKGSYRKGLKARITQEMSSENLAISVESSLGLKRWRTFAQRTFHCLRYNKSSGINPRYTSFHLHSLCQIQFILLREWAWVQVLWKFLFTLLRKNICDGWTIFSAIDQISITWINHYLHTFFKKRQSLGIQMEFLAENSTFVFQAFYSLSTFYLFLIREAQHKSN